MNPPGVQDAAPGDARAYLGKATEYLDGCRDELAEKRFSVAVGLAVTSGIASANAITAARCQTVWRGQAHSGAVKHVKTAGPEGVKAGPQLSRLLKLKNRAQYDPEPSSLSAARDAVKAAERLHGLAATVLDA